MRTKWITAALLAAGMAAGMAGAGPALADEGFELDDSGLTYNGPGDFRVQVGGRLHVDTAAFDDEVTQFDDSTDVRRLRVEAAIRFTDKLRGRVDYDFAPDSDGWRNAWLQYEFNDNLSLRAGNQIVPFSMEDMASSNETTFLERALNTGLAPGYGMAGVVLTRGDGWTAQLSYFEEPLGTESDNESDADETGASVRVTYAPIRRNRHVLHFGAAAQTRDFSDEARFRIRLRPESGLANNRLVDTGRLSSVDGYQAYNFEAAYMRGPFSVQGEYARLDLDRSNRPDPTFHTGYVQVSYVLTGERRDYSESRGVLGGVNVRRDRQAFEIAARYSVADLDSETVTGGQERNLTLGANWYVNRNVRLMANYVHATADPNRNGVEEELDIWQARLQVAF